MQLSSLQLECQRLGADMTLSTGCVLQSFYDDSYHILILGQKKRNGCMYQVGNQDNSDYTNEEDMMDSYKNHGHPIDRGRLCYLYRSQNKKAGSFFELLDKFCSKSELYQGNILTRPDEVLNEVRNFLFSIQPPCPQQ